MLTRPEYHDLKNHMAISLGMLELLIRTLKKAPPAEDTLKSLERAEKSYNALQNALKVINIGHDRAKQSDPG